MTIDSTYTFSLNETQLITSAMQLVGALGSGETPDPNDYVICQTMLNSMLKSWDGLGSHQWKLIPATLLLTANTASYTFNSTARASETVVYTTVNSAISSNVSNVVITAASVSGINVNDNVGLVQDDGSILYGTVTAISSSNLTTNITTTKTSAVGNAVFTYTTTIPKPLNIIDVRRQSTDGTEIPLTPLTSTEYFELTNKNQTGTPVSYYFQPLLTTSMLYLWPPSSDMTLRINFRYQKQLSDFLTSTNNPDFPQEFYLAAIYNLAILIAPSFGRLNELEKITPMAVSLMKTVTDWDTEHTSIQFAPKSLPGDYL